MHHAIFGIFLRSPGFVPRLAHITQGIFGESGGGVYSFWLMQRMELCGMKDRHWVQGSWGKTDLGESVNCIATLFSVVSYV